MMDSITDRELIEKLIAHDEQAYEILLDKFESSVFRFFYYSKGNHQIAQDLCGETFARFVAAIKNFRSDNSHSLKAFVFAIARNILLENLRKKRLVKEDTSLLQEIASNKPSVFREVSSHDELEYVLSIIKQFRESERQILLFRFIEGLKIEEIADVMKMSVNSVKSHIHRSRKKICEILSKNNSHKEEFCNE
ncbi:MAG: sigma-70 family RNA polymerase sigma factor [Sedimentisphaerales bacterium]|nr:sigma-70 family RNA polymerase sigma factor [Sedimentisphaerales bacterium]